MKALAGVDMEALRLDAHRLIAKTVPTIVEDSVHLFYTKGDWCHSLRLKATTPIHGMVAMKPKRVVELLARENGLTLIVEELVEELLAGYDAV